MTRLLILGGGGMLGHKLWQRLHDRFDARVTLRGSFEQYARFGIFDRHRTIADVDAAEFDTVVRAFAITRPDVAVNAIGIVKQVASANDPLTSIPINSLFPHRLANLCGITQAKLIHISTDCVFSGEKGSYVESDTPDPTDLYGRSKLLGEVMDPPALTLRTSIIGRELRSANGLVDWFLSNRKERVRGYRRAVFSGLTTGVLSQVIGDVIENHSGLSGLYHVSADRINKHDLLQLVRDAYELPIEIQPDDEVRIDRSLDSSRFRAATGWSPPSWPDMVRDLAADTTPYDDWR